MFDVFTMKSMRQPLIQSSGSFYLTLASIIQSLALAFLLEHVFDAVASGATSLGFWLRSATLFLIIILIWHEYAIGAATYFWMIDLLDSCIPFLFAVAQYMLIHFSEPGTALFSLRQPHAWLMSLVIVTLVAIFAYSNQIRKVRQYQQGIEFLPASQGGLKLALLTTAILLALFLCSVFDLVRINLLPDAVIPGVVLLLVVLHAFRNHRSWNRQMSNLALQPTGQKAAGG